MRSLRDNSDLWDLWDLWDEQISEISEICEIYEIFDEKMKYLWQMRSLRSIRSLKFNSIKINYLSGELHTILSVFITHFLNDVITNWSVLYNIFFNIFCLTNLKIKNIKIKGLYLFKKILQGNLTRKKVNKVIISLHEHLKSTWNLNHVCLFVSRVGFHHCLIDMLIFQNFL